LHLAGFEAFGAEVKLEAGNVVARAPSDGRLRAAEIHFTKSTVTGTENLMMAATPRARNDDASQRRREPEIVDLADLLNKMGARVNGAGSETIQIEGVESLGGAEHTIIPDRIETGTFIVAAR
jgi:UDP-N-acetylglucosamine 1-carboxyvinyltransferase